MVDLVEIEHNPFEGSGSPPKPYLKTVWRIADNRIPVPDPKDPTRMTTLGARLSRGAHWRGYMDLTDADINRRFDNRVKDRPEW